jgi:hypothetical protein
VKRGFAQRRGRDPDDRTREMTGREWPVLYTKPGCEDERHRSEIQGWMFAGAPHFDRSWFFDCGCEATTESAIAETWGA